MSQPLALHPSWLFHPSVHPLRGRQGEALPQNNILPHLPPPSWMYVRFNPPFTVNVQDSPPPHYCCGLLCSQPCVLNPWFSPPTTTTRRLPRMSRGANAVTTATGGRLTSIAPPFFPVSRKPTTREIAFQPIGALQTAWSTQGPFGSPPRPLLWHLWVVAGAEP